METKTFQHGPMGKRSAIVGLAVAALFGCSGQAPHDPSPGGDFSADVNQLTEALRHSGHHIGWEDHGIFCGGPSSRQCDDDRVCVHLFARSCSTDEHYGICLPKPRHCPPITHPVCGCDGTTYENFCAAIQAGVAVDERGECPEPPEEPECGGPDQIQCPGLAECVDDPSDNCTGHDCPGMCDCKMEEKCDRGEVFDSSPMVCACVAEDACGGKCPARTECVVGPDGTGTCEPTSSAATAAAKTNPAKLSSR